MQRILIPLLIIIYFGLITVGCNHSKSKSQKPSSSNSPAKSEAKTTPQAKQSAEHPAVYIEKGACPFECCTYGEWQTRKTTIAYAKPDEHSKVVGKFLAGTKVTAITGEVRSVAGRFVVTKPHEQYRPGDIIWVYAYGGEGLFSVWFNGEMTGEELGFSPYNDDTNDGTKCEDASDCWGKLDKKLQSEWWIKIKSKEGWIGWTKQPDNFGGKDECE